MTPSGIRLKLKKFWEEVLSCNDCGFSEGYGPQMRPIGPCYTEGGVVFAQINPGHIGRLSDDEIEKKYKREYSRDVALKKADSTNKLIALQDSFLREGCDENWSRLCEGYLGAMRSVWGWPPGKYVTTIESHGVDFDSVAIINLAQCPIPNDKYNDVCLAACAERHTYGLIKLLKPRLIVAQGKTAYRFLNDNPNITVPVLEGVHHASRQRKEVKSKQFDEIGTLLKKDISK